MVSFLIYLFESGICLALLFLVYFLFLRKETYFTFNRIYLITILVLSFLLPLLHLNLTLPESKQLGKSVDEINRIKNYYENLIALTDPDYENSFTKAFRENQTDEFEDGASHDFVNRTENAARNTEENLKNIKTGFWANINWARVLLILYLLGILFFTARLLLLFRWLNLTIKKYGSTTNEGVKLVQMDEEVPPFSFFRFVFLNRETDSHSGFAQILTHEKVHISQRHSYDLLLAHAITIIQWFNPFVWLINNAMKTNHEYIADRNVVEQGYELFDYQSLLLKQIISIRSVELVNNFNLINIKKRIAMMTKIKSGLAAQIKALVVIPTAILMFFFFTEITFAQNENISLKTKDITNEIQGFWKNKNTNDYGQLLNFMGNDLQILESNEDYREIQFKSREGTYSATMESFNTNKFFKQINTSDDFASLATVPAEPGKSRLILLSIKNDELIVGWSPEQVSHYKRIKTTSSLEYFSNSINEDFEPTSTSYYRISENPDKTFFLLMNKKGQMLVDGEKVDFEDLQGKIMEIKSGGNPFGSDEKIPVMVVDARCEMAYVNVMYKKLREMDELRHILSVKPMDEKVPEVFYHNVGIPRLLPPKDAKFMDEEKVEKSGMKIIRINLTKGITPERAASIFNKEIQKDKKFIVLYTYQNKTTYKEYLSVLDEFYQIIFAKRDLLAHEKYNLGFDDLAKAQQKEIRRSFPMVLTEWNVDQDRK